MKCDLIIAGVGGQGILSIAAVLGRAALAARLHVKQSEVHGMAQRGGCVQSHLRFSDRAVWSDVIPRGAADVILGMEPMEALRHLPWLAPDGWLLSNQTPTINIPDYPPPADLLEAIDRRGRAMLFDAEKLAREAGSPRAANMAMLGAVAPFIGFDAGFFEQAIRAQFESKGEEVIAVNLAAFRAARQLALARRDNPAPAQE